MKKLKYILCALVLMVSLSVPFVLAGCTKNYTVTVSINNKNYGKVVTVDSVTHISKSLVGKNEVEQGKDFEYVVAPLSHYYIKSIKVDGKAIEFTTDKDNIARPCLKNVKAKHKIVVEFAPMVYKFSIYYYQESENNYKLLTDESGNMITIDVPYKQNVTVAGIKDFGFMYHDGDNGLVYYNFNGSDTFTIAKDYALYTTKSVAEIKALLGK